MTFMLRIICIAVVVIMVGCASYPVNPPLDEIVEGVGYSSLNLARVEGNTTENYVLLALSGGGFAGYSRSLSIN